MFRLQERHEFEKFFKWKHIINLTLRVGIPVSFFQGWLQGNFTRRFLKPLSIFNIDFFIWTVGIINEQ